MEEKNGSSKEVDEVKNPVFAPAHSWQYSVNYGAKLESRKCKLFCPRCGFYHSCCEP